MRARKQWTRIPNPVSQPPRMLPEGPHGPEPVTKATCRSPISLSLHPKPISPPPPVSFLRLVFAFCSAFCFLPFPFAFGFCLLHLHHLYDLLVQPSTSRLSPVESSPSFNRPIPYSGRCRIGLVFHQPLRNPYPPALQTNIRLHVNWWIGHIPLPHSARA